MKNLTVILGAGASSGSVEPGVTSESRLVPPVTKDLFSTKYDDILLKFGDVKGATTGLSSEIQDGVSLEDYLKENVGTISRYKNLSPNRKRIFNQLPLYFQHLFTHLSRELKDKNIYYRFVDFLFNRGLNITFLTLNYDLLLDHAIERQENSRFTGFGSYTANPDRCILVKPHGSVNWFRQIWKHNQTGNTFESWKEIVRNLDQTEDLSKDISFIDLEAKFNEGFVDSLPYYPVLAIPNTEYHPIYPIDDLLDKLKQRLSQCENFLIIGYSGFDKDFLNLLKENVSVVKNLLIVGRESVGDVYERLTKGAPVFKVNNPSNSQYKDGFSKFIRVGVEVNKFLDKL